MALAIAATAMPLVVSCSSGSGSNTARMRHSLHGAVALSPDGRTIAFSAAKGMIGLYDWRTGEIRTVPLPLGIDHFVSISYSPDGRKLTGVVTLPRKDGEVISQFELGIFDLVTQQMASFPIEGVVSNTVFRPDGKAILYQAGSLTGRQLFLFDLKTETSKELLSKQDAFYTIFSPSFVSSDTVLFVGMGPKNPELKAAVQSLGINPISGPVPYLLKVGSKAEIAYLDVLNRYLDGLRTSGPILMPASRNGERIVFIGLSQSNAARQAYAAGDLARYDLFVIEGGEARQVTHLENYMAYSSISQDGSTAAFGIYPGPLSDVRGLGRGKIPLALAIVDLNTGQVTRTDFVERRAKAWKDSSLRSE